MVATGTLDLSTKLQVDMFIPSGTAGQPKSPRVLVVVHVISVAWSQCSGRFDCSPTGRSRLDPMSAVHANRPNRHNRIFIYLRRVVSNEAGNRLKIAISIDSRSDA